MDSVGERIKKLRISFGMTQSQLAEKLNISPSAVGMYEHSRRRPDNEMLVKLGRLFSVSTDSLLGVGESVLEAEDIINEMSNRIRNSNVLMLNGVPMSAEDRERLIYAMEVAVKIALENSN